MKQCIFVKNVVNDFYFLNGTNNCYQMKFTENGYYLDSDLIFKKCYEGCRTCSGGLMIDSDTLENNHSCIECADNYYNLKYDLYPNNCYDIKTINSWKYFEESTINFLASTVIEEIEMTEKITNNLESTYLEKPIEISDIVHLNNF